MLYLVDGTLEFTRNEMVDFLIDYIYENELVGKLGNLLPAHTVEQNAKHHAVRLMREIGFEVVTLR